MTKLEKVLDIFLLFVRSFFLSFFFNIFLKFFLKKFKSSIIPLISTFITDYFAKKKKEDPIFFKSKLHIYIYFYNF